MKTKQSLFVNGVEVLRIENGEFWKESDDSVCLEKTDPDTLWEKIGKYNWILNSNNKKLEDEYLDLIAATLVAFPKI